VIVKSRGVSGDARCGNNHIDEACEGDIGVGRCGIAIRKSMDRSFLHINDESTGLQKCISLGNLLLCENVTTYGC